MSTREKRCASQSPAGWVSEEVLEAPYPLLLRHGRPDYIRSDNGPEFAAASFKEWLVRVGIQPARQVNGVVTVTVPDGQDGIGILGELKGAS